MKISYTYKVFLEDKRKVALLCEHEHFDPSVLNACIFHEHLPNEELAETLLSLYPTLRAIKIKKPGHPLEHTITYARQS